MRFLVVFLGLTVPLFSKTIPETEAMKKVVEKVEIECPFSGQQARIVLDVNVEITVHKGQIIEIKFKGRVHRLFRDEINKKMKKWRFISEQNKWKTTIHLKKNC